MAPSTLSLFLTALMFAAVLGADGDLDAACISPGNTCTDTANHVCDTHRASALCKIKAATTCTGNTGSCVAGATCDSSNNCVCGGDTAADANGLCELDPGESCSSDQYLCKSGTTCDNNICKLDAGGDCSTTDSGNCKTGTTCESDVCKVPLGGICAADAHCVDTSTMDCDDVAKKCLLKADQPCNSPTTNNDKCVSGASCDTTGDSPTNNCVCIANVYTKDTTNEICKAADGKVTGDCKTGSTCDDVNAECDGTICKCKAEYNLKAADATCEKSGAISVIASALTVMLVAASGRLFSLH